MTVSGILSGLADPYGAGHALSRIAARDEAARSTETPPSRPLKEPSRFDTQDRVELSGSSEPRELTPEEQERVQALQKRDVEVRQHEAAHAAAAGAHAQGGARFEYETGPDGRQYAVGGEVSIDTSAVEGDPEATIAKMAQIRVAALAPADPSAQDRSVAAQASAEIQKSRAEQAEQPREEDGNEKQATASAETARPGDAVAGRPSDGPAIGGASSAPAFDRERAASSKSDERSAQPLASPQPPQRPSAGARPRERYEVSTLIDTYA